MTRDGSDPRGSAPQSGTSRRAFFGLAGSALAAASACSSDVSQPTVRTTARASTRRRVVAENSLPGDPHWAITNLGASDAIMGYTGKASVLTGESFPLFVSTTSSGFQVRAFRVGWYDGDGARQVWESASVRGHQQNGPGFTDSTNTVHTDWDPVLEVPTDDWPAGAYLLRLDADSGAQRYVPVIVRSASTAGKVVLKAAIETWQAYNTWGGYDLYIGGADQSYGDRSLAVSLNRPYDLNGADMFLTYERNMVLLAEALGLSPAYVTSMDIAGNPNLLDGASALISGGHDEYWTPAERAHVTAARDAGVNLAFLGANAMFRRTRLDDGDRLVICYKTSYTEDPMYGVDNALVTSDWREPPDPDPESSLIGTIYEGYPAQAPYVVVSPDAWLFAGTGVGKGASFVNLVGIEYDRVNPAYPVERPIQVLSHSPLVCLGASSFGDSAYYTHSGGAGVFNSGTMRWVGAIYGDPPHGIVGRTPPFVKQVTTNVLRAFADGPAAHKYPAHDNLDAMHEYVGDPVGNPANLQ